MKQTVLLQRSQRDGKHLLRDVGNGAQQLAEAQPVVVREGVEHEHRPLVADAREYVAYRAVGRHGAAAVCRLSPGLLLLLGVVRTSRDLLTD